MGSKTPSELLLANLPNYHDLFDEESRSLLSCFNIMIIKGLFNHSNFTRYHKKYPSHYILPADLTKIEADHLIKHLKEGTIETSMVEQDLVDRFQQNLWDKIGSMFEALNNYQATYDPEQLKILESEAHKIAGSAACYGYKSLGDLSRQMDVYFQEKHTSEENIRYCAHQLRNMLFAFQKIETSY